MIILKQKVNKNYAYETKVERKERIPIVSDVMFHTMLNNENRKKYTSYILSLITNIEYEEILNNIKFIKNKIDKENYYESRKTVDLVCKIDNEIYNIEMNNNATIKALERNISYISRLYDSKMKIGKKYEYQKVMQININNFSFEGNEKTVEKYYLKNEEGEILTDKIIIIYIYLPNIRKKYYNKEKLSELEKMMIIMNEKDSKEIDRIIRGSEIMGEYREESLEASLDEEIIGLYDKEEYDEMIKQAMIDEAKEEGYDNGITQGINQGILQKTKESAMNMYEKNIDKQTICDCLNITLEELEEMLKTKNKTY